MSNTTGKIEAIDLLDVQGWLEGWGDYSNRGSYNNNLGYRSPNGDLLRDNVQRASRRPVLFDMNDEAYYTLIERELGAMRTSSDSKLRMWADLIKYYYLYRMSYTQVSKSVLSKYIHGPETTKMCRITKVQRELALAERLIYDAILRSYHDL